MPLTVPKTATYRVAIDWSNDGTFTGPYDDVTADVLAAAGISCGRGRDQLRTNAPPRIGDGSFALKNDDRTYSAEFPGSPVYTEFETGREVAIAASYGVETGYDEDLGYDEPLWVYDGIRESLLLGGVIDNPTQNPARDARSVGIDVVESLAIFSGYRVSTTLYQGIETGAAIGHVLDAVGWPAGSDYRDRDAGETTLLFWWLAEEDAWSGLMDLVAVEGPGAMVGVDELGRFYFRSRNWMSTQPRSTTVQATYWDRAQGAERGYDDELAYDQADEFYDGTGGLHHVGTPAYDEAYRDVVTACSVETVRRSYAALADVWTYGATIDLAAGEVRTFTATPSDPFDSAVVTNGIDVLCAAGSIASVSYNRDSGQVVKITLTAGGAGASVSTLKLRARAYPVISTTNIDSTVDVATAIAKYKTKVETISGRTDLDPNVALDLANTVVRRYSRPRPQASVTLFNDDAAHLYELLWRRVGDRVRLVESHTGIAHDYWIHQIGHRVDAAGLLHWTTFGCEKAFDQDVTQVYGWDAASATWGTATWGA